MQLNNQFSGQLNSHFNNNQSSVQHYNQITKNARRQNRNEDTNCTRFVNNLVKSLLFNYCYDTFVQTNFPQDRIHLLDLACGKGGDILKWRFNLPQDSIYVGVDSSDASVDEAKRRLLQCYAHNHRNQCYFGKDKSVLIKANMASPKLAPTLQQYFNQQEIFHVVSMQMALHYVTKTPEYLCNTLQNISSMLYTNGIFIVTFMNPQCIIAELGSPMCQEIRLYTKHSNYSNNCQLNIEEFGQQYHVHLDNCVHDLAEYIVPLKQLYRIAKQYNLMPIEKGSFEDILESNYINNNRHFNFLKNKTMPEHVRMSGKLQDIIQYDAGMYMYVIFQKL